MMTIPKGRLSLSLGLLAAAVTAYQVVLMQVLAYVYGYHFAYLVVSLALLGFGASGALLFLLGERTRRIEGVLLPGCAAGAALLMAGAPPALNLPFLRLDPLLLLQVPAQWAILAGLALIFFLPFFLAGLFIGHVLTTRVRAVGRLYAADLAGSGLGGLCGFSLLAFLLPWHAAGVAGLLAVAAAFPVLRASRAIQVTLTLAGLLAVSALGLGGDRAPEPSPMKAIHGVRGLPDVRTTHTDPGTHGVLEQVESPHLRQLPGLSLAAPALETSRPRLFLNAETVGALGRPPGEDGTTPMTWSGEVLGYVGEARRRILLLESEGGPPLELALALEPERVQVAEPIGSVRRRLRETFPEATSPDGPVTLSGLSPRAVLRTGPPEAWDLIRFPTLGGAGGDLGFSALGENYLLTLEGIREAWHALRAEGRMLFTIWPDYPPRNLQKLINLIREALAAEGVDDPRSHLVAWRGWGNLNLVLFRNPPGEAVLEAIRRRAEKLQLDLLLFPGLEAGARERFHQVADPGFFTAMDALLDPEEARAFREASVFRLRAPTDDRPFFDQYLKPTRIGALAETVGWDRLYFLELGTVAVLLTLGGLGLSAGVIILVPVGVRLKKRGQPLPVRTLLYFAALGTGFMAVEIILIQKLHLVLGNAIRAAALVLSTLLLFSGLGSLLSGTFKDPLAARRRATLGAAACIVLLALVFQVDLLPRALTAHGWAAAGTCVALLAPTALLMGFPFPLGLRRLESAHPEAPPWAWAINGCFSVITPPLATLLAVSIGFTPVLLLAAGAYGLAAVVDPGKP
ncbi:MAG: hypothetical protein ACFE0O_01705 [Opitutales bacterium]